MAEREDLLVALAQEVLGPRGPADEVLRAPTHRGGEAVNPLEEYITGVLAPRDGSASEEIDSSDDLLGEQDENADDSIDTGGPAFAVGGSPTSGTARSPSLDPRSRPCSIGLSILVAGEHSEIDICSTWAWYLQMRQGEWTRTPRSELWLAVDCQQIRQERVIEEADGQRRVSLQIRSRRSGSAWHVSIFLVNSTTAVDPRAEHHVYQPQIRIRVGNKTDLLPLDSDQGTADPESASLSLLYRNRRALARGHLCSAIWRAIDPELPFSTSRPQRPPFFWLDGSLLSPEVAARFSPADARTELMPCYSIQAPELNAAGRHGQVNFDPEALSQLWSPDSLRSALFPLVDAYQRWINDQEAEIPSLESGHALSARAQIVNCREALRRIQQGINLLCTDEASRLAFCFANKAIALQSRWTRNLVVPWRPFQLAFQLLNLYAVRFAESPERLVCDVLWVPTGGGKTEAYLGLAAFAFALRRLSTIDRGLPEGGVSVISRYTLRLLTIQQFRRALTLVTACEVLRVTEANNIIGWRPSHCDDQRDFLWGRTRFSIGLWVGGSVTPNGLFDFKYRGPDGRIHDVRGALSILRGEEGEGEPAQVLTCPCCNSILALPPDGIMQNEDTTLHLVVQTANPIDEQISPATFSGPAQPPPLVGPLFDVSSVSVTRHDNSFSTLSVTFRPARDVSPQDLDRWCNTQVLPVLGRRSRLVSARATRPGYFLQTAAFQGGNVHDVNFEIFCPNPRCDLNNGPRWSETSPAGTVRPPDAFSDQNGRATRIPIPALTVDDQIYHRCPTMVVATVDKFARLAFEPRASSLFGLVDHYCDRYGYYRAGSPPSRSLPAGPTPHPPGVTPIPVLSFHPPDLVLQDELHLIEGPLGSMVGLYETAIEALGVRSMAGRRNRAKYIGSSATIRRADDQVQSLYCRALAAFPPAGITIDDNFFTSTREAHALDSASAGRLYVGLCAPGRGAQTPIIRIWASVLQHIQQRLADGASQTDVDPFWTLVGYFNAIRELAGVVALARQDIPERMGFISPTPRNLPENEPIELSSRIDSMQLPGVLERLKRRLVDGNAINAVLSTSMFGTGVDVSRLGLMVVHGQPKTTSAYIQATGRVGREEGGLVVSFYRASRPRDLSHYEYFAAYHRELYRHVEPITVSPFSPRARDRGLGPVTVAMLRQASELQVGTVITPVQYPWHIQQRHQNGWFCRASVMATAQASPEVSAVTQLLELRAGDQPRSRRPENGIVVAEATSEVARWAQLAAIAGASLLYFESSLVYAPSNMVVLGDLAHEVGGLPVAYENAPNSLREVESTTTFRGRS
jgi:hypothetical protein